MKSKQAFSFRARINSFSYSFQGIRTLFKYEHNAWIHACATLIVLILGGYFKLSISEWCWITLAIGIVFIAEMMNTAIEYLTDFISPEIHPLAKKIKDVSSGAVLIAALVSLLIGLLIFVPKFSA